MGKAFPWIITVTFLLLMMFCGVRAVNFVGLSSHHHYALVGFPTNMFCVFVLLSIRVFWAVKTGSLNGNFNKRNKLLWSTIFFALVSYTIISVVINELPLPQSIKAVLDLFFGFILAGSAFWFYRDSVSDET